MMKTKKIKVINTEPPDGGWGWVIVICGFFNLLIIIGLVNGLGICLANFKEDLQTNTSIAAGVVSSLPAIIMSTNMLASNLSRRFGERIVMFVGGLLASCGCILASFSTHIIHLYLTISLLGGIGYGLVFQPTIVMPAYYFKKYYGIAHGFTFSGIGFGMIVLPPVLRMLIDEYSWRGMFFIIGGVTINMCIISRLMRAVKVESKPNTSTLDIEMNEKNEVENFASKSSTFEKDETVRSEKTYKRALKKFIMESALWFMLSDCRRIIFFVVIALMGASSFTVIVHFPYRITVSGTSEEGAIVLMSILGGGSLLSRLTHGWLVDKKVMSIENLYALSVFLAGILCFFCTISESFTWLVIFALVYGLTSGVYNPIFIPYVRNLVGDKKFSMSLGIIFPVFGLAHTTGGMFAGWLYDTTGSYDASFYFAGTGHIVCVVLLCINPVLARRREGRRITKREKLGVEI